MPFNFHWRLVALAPCFMTGCAALSLFSTTHQHHYEGSEELQQRVDSLEHRVMALERTNGGPALSEWKAAGSPKQGTVPVHKTSSMPNAVSARASWTSSMPNLLSNGAGEIENGDNSGAAVPGFLNSTIRPLVYRKSVSGAATEETKASDGSGFRTSGSDI